MRTFARGVRFRGIAPLPRNAGERNSDQALSTLLPAEGSDPEASWLTCAEYRMNLRATIFCAQKKLCKRTSHVTPTVADPTSAPAAASQCLPAASITALASAPPLACGHTKRPRSKRFENRQSPSPSNHLDVYYPRENICTSWNCP
jgi:hypothetical protein